MQQDLKMSVRYLQLVKEKNLLGPGGYSTIALYGLGISYVLGTGVEKSEEIAFNYFKMACEQGYPKAQFEIANRYLSGLGVKKSFENAIHLYKLIIDQKLDGPEGLST